MGKTRCRMEELNKEQGYCDVKVNDLLPAKWNYKEDSDYLREKLKLNIRKNGNIINLIVRDVGNGKYEVIDGNHRLDVLKELGYEKVHVFNLGQIDIREAKKIAILANETKFENNDAELAAILGELAENATKVQIEKELPFTAEEIDAYLELNAYQLETAFNNEGIAPYSPITNNALKSANDYLSKRTNRKIDLLETHLRKGDVIKLGKHVLYHNDAREIDLSEQQFIVTDPPYEMSTDTVCDVVEEARHILIMVTFSQGVLLYNKLVNEKGLKFGFDLVWNQKIPASTMNKKDPYRLHRNVLYFHDENETIFHCDNAQGFFLERGYYPSIIEAPKSLAKLIHPLEKPLDAYLKMISGFRFDTICDPFSGGGTAILAAEILNRQCVAVEIDAKCCQAAIINYKFLCETLDKEPVITINDKPYN
ncbi:hypothetical protein D6827_01600 [Candidatus Parcubacteria bacterium]|nr:MAG: hypothetical protein D6827_01600 [Candidatus Parcubacteria bacterium]